MIELDAREDTMLEIIKREFDSELRGATCPGSLHSAGCSPRGDKCSGCCIDRVRNKIEPRLCDECGRPCNGVKVALEKRGLL